MVKSCPHLDYILKLAQAKGNEILHISKSESMKKVVWMNNPLLHSSKDEIKLGLKDLKYQQKSSKPHDPANEYFICNKCKTVLVFPCKEAG